MSTPDDVLGFPVFPPSTRGRGRFARSWQGLAWVQALEDTALALGPLKHGRRLAYAGRVGSITVCPGRLASTVDGSPEGLFTTTVTLPRLSDAEWTRFLDRAGASAGHLAALLDGVMPQDLVDSAEDAGVRLLPDIGDLEPECDCPGWELPCAHAAALCYQVSWLLDADPFVLFLLRGRGKRQVLAELQLRTAPAREVPAGVSARAAYASAVPDLPELPPLDQPIRVELPPAPGLEALPLLIDDAAARARRLLTADEPVLGWWPDTVRMAATCPGALARLRDRAPAREGELDRAVAEWSFGGLAALKVLESPWNPPQRVVARVRTAIGGRAELEIDQNRFTLRADGVQLRWGRDQRWYPYRHDAGQWWPAGAPSNDLETLLVADR